MLLKDLLSPAFVDDAAMHIAAVLPTFSKTAFTAAVFDEQWPKRELKQRIRHIATCLHAFMPKDFTQAADLLIQLSKHIREHKGEMNFGYMFLCDYVEVYGLEHLEDSMRALEDITQLMSAEFAVRPFLIRYPDAMHARMLAWSKHHNPQVRRLSSEGFRPRLPWGMAVPHLKKNPSPILPVLENLKEDPVEFVRRSVANNLNDISKDHPELALELARKWKGISPEVDWIVKHGCRSLLKKGHDHAVGLFEYSDLEGVRLEGFQLDREEVTLGEYLPFRFEVHNDSDAPKSIRLEYAVYFLRANGDYSKKVFKISEKSYPANSVARIERRQHFLPITTRRYYPGKHEVGIILNGKEFERRTFSLICP